MKGGALRLPGSIKAHYFITTRGQPVAIGAETHNPDFSFIAILKWLGPGGQAGGMQIPYFNGHILAAARQPAPSRL